jgi:acyl carrier protein
MSTQVPRGIEVLVKKASVDPAFKAILLERRAAAADEIGLHVEPAEAAILAAIPRGQLETIVANTDVPQSHRRAFLGQAAAAMLAVLGVGAIGGPAFAVERGSSGGIRPYKRTDKKPDKEPEKKEEDPDEKEKIIKKRVAAIIAKRFKVAEKELKDESLLVEDLRATASQRAGLKRQLETQFRIKIPRKDFDKARTVRDVAECVNEAFRRKPAPKSSVPVKSHRTHGVPTQQPQMPAVGGMTTGR